jgi:hypothetical protein
MTPTRTNTRAGAGVLLLRFVELQIPMALGALVCYLLIGLIPASSSLAATYHPGTYPFAVGDLFFLTVPAVAWRILRGHAWRSSLELAVAMLAPVATIMALGELTGYPYLPSLTVTGYPAMSLRMLVYLLHRSREHAHGA